MDHKRDYSNHQLTGSFVLNSQCQYFVICINAVISICDTKWQILKPHSASYIALVQIGQDTKFPDNIGFPLM